MPISLDNNEVPVSVNFVLTNTTINQNDNNASINGIFESGNCYTDMTTTRITNVASTNPSKPRVTLQLHIPISDLTESNLNPFFTKFILHNNIFGIKDLTASNYEHINHKDDVNYDQNIIHLSVWRKSCRHKTYIALQQAKDFKSFERSLKVRNHVVFLVEVFVDVNALGNGKGNENENAMRPSPALRFPQQITILNSPRPTSSALASLCDISVQSDDNNIYEQNEVARINVDNVINDLKSELNIMIRDTVSNKLHSELGIFKSETLVKNTMGKLLDDQNFWNKIDSAVDNKLEEFGKRKLQQVQQEQQEEIQNQKLLESNRIEDLRQEYEMKLSTIENGFKENLKELEEALNKKIIELHSTTMSTESTTDTNINLDSISKASSSSSTPQIKSINPTMSCESFTSSILTEMDEPELDLSSIRLRKTNFNNMSLLNNKLESISTDPYMANIPRSSRRSNTGIKPLKPSFTFPESIPGNPKIEDYTRAPSSLLPTKRKVIGLSVKERRLLFESQQQLKQQLLKDQQLQNDTLLSDIASSLLTNDSLKHENNLHRPSSGSLRKIDLNLNSATTPNKAATQQLRNITPVGSVTEVEFNKENINTGIDGHEN